MITINLHQVNTIDKTIDFPQTWDELELPELEAIARLLISDLHSADSARSIMLLEILKHRAKAKRIPVSIIQQLDPEQLFIDGLPLVEFIFTENTLTKQPYKKLKTPLGLPFFSFRGPLDDFEDLTAGEFEAAEINFLQYSITPDAQLLANIAAILYRPKGEDFLKYNAASDKYITYPHEAMAKRFARQPPYKLFLIYMWYAGCRNRLPLYFPTLYESDEKAKGVDLMVFTKCVHAAAGEKNGNREQVRRTLLKALYYEMDLEAIKAKELKELYERK